MFLVVYYTSFIDYPYGVFINGSTYGSSHLITPQPATYSLFSITAGSYLFLSQSDYMSIMSLVISYFQQLLIINREMKRDISIHLFKNAYRH